MFGFFKKQKKIEMLERENICLKHPSIKNRNLLNQISFDLKKGEILGFFGLMGAGRTELLQTIFGTKSSSYKRFGGFLCNMRYFLCTSGTAERGTG